MLRFKGDRTSIRSLKCFYT